MEKWLSIIIYSLSHNIIQNQQPSGGFIFEEQSSTKEHKKFKFQGWGGGGKFTFCGNSVLLLLISLKQLRVFETSSLSFDNLIKGSEETITPSCLKFEKHINNAMKN